ncbi:MAG: mechanosensitive ion channel family protein, partial [Muribaculaceae bacterium]|nr:mechanosensitive ion channel family protein [Muribaculaceae bacterium]
MRRITAFLVIWFSVGIFTYQAHSQLIKKAGEFISTAFEESDDSLMGEDTKNLPVEERIRRDSLRLHEMTLRLKEMEMKSLMLQTELDNANNRSFREDSIKRAAQMRQIDSLRSVTRGVPVVVENDTLFLLYASMGGRSALDRAERIAETIEKIGKTRSLSRDTLHSFDNESYVDIMYGDKVIMSVTEQDAMWAGTSREKLVDSYMRLFSAKIAFLQNENSFWQMMKRLGLFVAVIIGQCGIFKVINLLFRRLRRRIVRFKQQKMRAFVVRGYEVLNKHRLTRVMILASNLVRYFILLIVLIVTVPILFSIFPQTENLAMKILYYILDPVKMVLKSVIQYIPNLFIILVIWYCVRYLVKGFRYLSHEIESEKLKINGFYPEWAQPTFNIVRFLLYAFMIAMIYPYLPGAHSGVFQGISVFVGLIVSLGSSTVISNFIAGFVITYMRPFKPGDFIKVKDTIGTVVE